MADTAWIKNEPQGMDTVQINLPYRVTDGLEVYVNGNWQKINLIKSRK